MFNLDFKLVYLAGILSILLLFVVVFLLRKDLRKILLYTGLLLALFGPISEILFFRDYWNPPALFEFNLFGVRILLEDALFAFSAPVLGAYVYFILFNKKLDKKFSNLKQYIIRFNLVSTPFIILFFFITLAFGINSIFSVVLTSIIMSTFVIWRRKDLLRVYLKTGILAVLGVFVFYYLYIVIIGENYLLSVWLLDHEIFGFRFLGTIVPITEVLFAATVMPCILLFTLFASKLREAK